MIYCDGEREQFDEQDFYTIPGEKQPLQPYIHIRVDPLTQRKTAHFADGGMPIALEEDQHTPHGSFGDGPQALNVPALLNIVSPTLPLTLPPEVIDELVELSLTSSEDKPHGSEGPPEVIDEQEHSPAAEGVDLETSLRCAGMNWPEPIQSAKDDPLGDQKKALYQSQLQLTLARLQGLIEHDKTVRGSDAPFHQAVFQAYLDAAKAQIDRSITRGQAVFTAAGAIGTIYTGILGLAFSVSQAGHFLPARGLIPAVFLGLAIACTSVYLAYIKVPPGTPSGVPPLRTFLYSRQPSGQEEPEATQPSGQDKLQRVSFLPSQRLLDERNAFIQWIEQEVIVRLPWLRAAVVSLALGVLFLPIAFVGLPDLFVWLCGALGLLVIFGVVFLSRAPEHVQRVKRKKEKDKSDASSRDNTAASGSQTRDH